MTTDAHRNLGEWVSYSTCQHLPIRGKTMSGQKHAILCPVQRLLIHWAF